MRFEVRQEPGVALTPAEIVFKVGFEELKYWCERENRWLMPKGKIKFMAE